MKNVKTSIIILTRNAGSRLVEVLNSVFKQSYKDFEVILIDSESTDKTLEIAKSFPVKIKSIKPENFGHGKTRNLGSKLAKGKYVVYLTHDAIPADKDWLKYLIAPLKNKEVAGVYSRQVPRENEKIIDRLFYISLYPDKEKIWKKGLFKQGDNIFSDVSSAIKRDLLLKNPFMENIIVSEDYEWARRILEKGMNIIYNPKSKVIHSHSYNLRQAFKRGFDIGVSYKSIYQGAQPSFITKGLKIHFNELKLLKMNKASYLIPYCILKDATKFIAINLGKNSHLLPNSINRAFSNYGGYWR
jgi:rhamnosyltransferase